MIDFENDTDYLALPQEERAKVVEHYLLGDKDFKGLPEPEKIKVLNHYVQLPQKIQINQPVLAQQKRDLVEESLRQIALAGRGVASGLSALPTLAAEGIAYPLNAATGIINQVFGTNIGRSEPMAFKRETIDKIYGVNPENATERVAQDVIGAVSSTGGMTALGSKLAQSTGPVISRVGQQLATAPLMQSVSAASTGAGSGVARESGAETTGQVLSGLVAGMAPTAALQTMNILKNAANVPAKSIGVTYSDKIRQREAEDIVRNLAADDKHLIRNALGARKTYLPGSRVTSAEAIAQGNLASEQRFGAPIVRMQTDIGRTQEATSTLNTIAKQRTLAHEKALDQIAGTPAKYQAAIKYRESQTKPFWEKVETSTANVNPKSVVSEIDRIIAKNPNESGIVNPLTVIKSKLVDENKPQNLASLSREIRNMMAKKTPSGDNEYDVKVLAQIKDQLDNAIGAAEPNYRKAMSLYKELSGPINRMEVGQVLKEKLLGVQGAETPGQYLRAANDAAKTIKKATGFARYNDLGEVLTKKEMMLVNRVAKDLERGLETKRIGSEVNLPGSTQMGQQAEFQMPNLLSRPVAATNWVLRHIGKDINPDINRRIASILSDPKKLDLILANTPRERIPELINAAKQARTGMFGGLIGAQQQEEQ